MLTIYAIPISLYCAKLRILLRHKQLQWQEIPPPGGYGSAEYKETVPSGNLPTLVDGSLMIADTEAIAEYLNEKHPKPAMLPVDISQRAKVRELSRFHDTRLEPELRKLFPQIAAENRDQVISDTQSKSLSARLHQLGTMLGDHDLSSAQLTLADCGFPITFLWMDALTPLLGLNIEWPETVLSYRQSLENHPTIASELSDYFPKISAYLKAPGH